MREDEIRRLGLLLSSSATHPTIEGDNGVGKTSLVSVVGYKARRRFEMKATDELIIRDGGLSAPDVGEVRRWLNAPIFSTTGGGGSA